MASSTSSSTKQVPASKKKEQTVDLVWKETDIPTSWIPLLRIWICLMVFVFVQFIFQLWMFENWLRIFYRFQFSKEQPPRFGRGMVMTYLGAYDYDPSAPPADNNRIFFLWLPCFGAVACFNVMSTLLWPLFEKGDAMKWSKRMFVDCLVCLTYWIAARIYFVAATIRGQRIIEDQLMSGHFFDRVLPARGLIANYQDVIKSLLRISLSSTFFLGILVGFIFICLKGCMGHRRRWNKIQRVILRNGFFCNVIVVLYRKKVFRLVPKEWNELKGSNKPNVTAPMAQAKAPAPVVQAKAPAPVVQAKAPAPVVQAKAPASVALAKAPATVVQAKASALLVKAQAPAPVVKGINTAAPVIQAQPPARARIVLRIYQQPMAMSTVLVKVAKPTPKLPSWLIPKPKV